MRRVTSRVVVLLALLALGGLAVACTGETAQEPAEEANTPSSSDAPRSTRDEETAEERTGQAEETRETTEAEKPEETDEESAAVDAYQYEGADDAQREEADDAQYEEADDAQREEADDAQYEEADDAQYKEADDEEAAPAPDDPTMYLSVPKLGISGTTVADGEAGLEIGAMHLAGTGYPWQEGANTYIAGHRVGFPGTGSDRIFYDLPLMAQGDEVLLEDSNGETYNYQVTEVFAVTPFDTWVTTPTGSDTVTLQVCTESPEDWFTIGPQLMESGPESGRLIVRAERVA